MGVAGAIGAFCGYYGHEDKGWGCCCGFFIGATCGFFLIFIFCFSCLTPSGFGSGSSPQARVVEGASHAWDTV